MPYVSALKESKKRRDRVNVFLDEKFWAAMSTDCLVGLGWYVELELTEEQVQQAAKEVLFSEALQYCMRVLSARARSSGQIRKGLREREFPDTVIDQAIERLTEWCMIDDQLFAEGLLQTGLNRGYGPTRISQMFTDKALSKELFADTVDLDNDTWAASARKACLRQFPRMQETPKHKAVQWLMRRGYSFDVIALALEDIEFADPAAVKAQKVYDLSALANDVARRYPQCMRQPKEKSKAWAFLARRGLGTDQIKEVFELAFSK